MDTTLTDMLLSLKNVLHSDMIHFMNQSKVREIGDQISYFKNKISYFAFTFKNLVDPPTKKVDNITWLKYKIMDLEDC